MSEMTREEAIKRIEKMVEGEYKVDIVDEWDNGRVRVDTTHTYLWDDEDNKWHK